MKPSTSIPVTAAMRALILHTLRTKSLSKTDLTNKLGLGKAWATKLLDGSLKTIKEKNLNDLEDYLGIRFTAIDSLGPQRSELAARIAALVDSNPSFTKLAIAIEEIQNEASSLAGPRYIPTQDMSRIGQEIIRLCFGNEDKPGKVAREVLKLLA